MKPGGPEVECWGRWPRSTPSSVIRPTWPDEIDLRAPTRPILPRGLGRSYGDSCLNDGGTLLDLTRLDRVHAFDPVAGLLRADAGISLAEVLRLVVPKGWFLPVCPGTRFVTLGGAVANDVHGKNHHVAGTFGRHVTAFELLRSDGVRRTCSADENPALYRATIGGLGLTGAITWVEIRMRRIASAGIDQERIRLPSLEAFFEADAESAEVEHTVAWVDLVDGLGRGIYIRGTPAADGPALDALPRPVHDVPFDAPSFLLGRATMRVFNALYWRSLHGDRDRRVVHWDPFFFPLDVVGHWNRLYGRRGFLQYQCVVGGDDGGRTGILEVARRIAASGEPVFLGVLKRFGELPSPGLLSFPRPGVTLAVDLPFRGLSTLRLLDTLDAVVADHGGAVYPAKDGRMSPEMFRRYYPDWEALERHRDPVVSSSFWRRVALRETTAS